MRPPAPTGNNSDQYLAAFLLLGVVLVALLMAFESLVNMVGKWDRAEYNHGYLIPLIALGLLIQRIPSLVAQLVRPSWAGVAVVGIAAAIMVLGSLSALHPLVQYGFILCLAGLTIATFGMQGLRALWAPLLYLFFMVPLPNFIFNGLSQTLQLYSSALGVELVHLAGISVIREGNVIDLIGYKLQVEEACSGLRYLFPLMSFGFLLGYLYRGPAWKRWFVFLATIPITVFMNGARIGVIALLLEFGGEDYALTEGAMHYFQGWIVFLLCLAVLFLITTVLPKIGFAKGAATEGLQLDLPMVSLRHDVRKLLQIRLAPLTACLFFIGAVATVNGSIDSRQELIPERQGFVSFPLLVDDWRGREQAISQDVLKALKVDDYLLAGYMRPSMDSEVNLYIAYYGSQSRGASAHSPRSCIPGDGWLIDQHTRRPLVLDGLNLDAATIAVNEVVIEKDGTRQLVYYFFLQRERLLTNEYAVKWYLFWDALTRQRTDGAMVRLVVPILPGSSIESARQTLDAFLLDFYPVIRSYVPDAQGNAQGW